MSSYSRKLCKVEEGEVAEPETDSKMVVPATLLKGNLLSWGHQCQRSSNQRDPLEGS